MTSANMTSTKTALVTGAAQRIGAEICQQLHARGFNIIVHYRASASAANSLRDNLNQLRANSCICLQADLESLADVTKLAQATLDHCSSLDVLINNASSFYPTPTLEASEEDWQALINANLHGPFFLSKQLLPALIKSQGCIINLVDIHSDKPMRNHSIYSIAKAGVAMMTKSLAQEFAPDVRVNGVSPGAILWPEFDSNAKAEQAILSKIPMQRIGETLDIANTVGFLVCDAPYITGQIIAVDGGRTLNM